MRNTLFSGKYFPVLAASSDTTAEQTTMLAKADKPKAHFPSRLAKETGGALYNTNQKVQLEGLPTLIKNAGRNWAELLDWEAREDDRGFQN